VTKILRDILNCLFTDKLKISMERHILHSVVLSVMTLFIYRKYGGSIFIKIKLNSTWGFSP